MQYKQGNYIQHYIFEDEPNIAVNLCPGDQLVMGLNLETPFPVPLHFVRSLLASGYFKRNKKCILFHYVLFLL